MKIEILDKPPISGSMPEIQFDAKGDCTWVKFGDGFDEWAGVFGKGYNSGNMDAAVLFNSGQHAFVIAGGQGYVVNIADKSLVYKTPEDYLQGVIAIPNRDLIITCDYTKLKLYDSNRKLWESDRMALDGIKFTGVTSYKVSGYIWQIEGWYSFAFDVDSRSITEQKFITSEWDFSEAKPKVRKSGLSKIIHFFRK